MVGTTLAEIGITNCGAAGLETWNTGWIGTRSTPTADLAMRLTAVQRNAGRDLAIANERLCHGDSV